MRPPTTPRPWPSAGPPWTAGSSSSTERTSHPVSAGQTARKTTRTMPPAARHAVYTPRVVGISLAFTRPAGISAEASGTAAPDGTLLTPDSMLQAGSVSKAVTAYAAHRLAAEGRLD